MRFVVTGATSDLGGAIARRLLADGHAVLAAGRRAERLDALAALGADVLDGDLTDPAHRAALAATGATGLVHAAGHTFPYQRFHAADPDTIAMIWAVDHAAFADLAARLVPAMMAARSGRVVAITSAAARLGSDGGAAYAAAKAATEALIRNLALEYGRFGITANAVSPGPILTERLEGRAPSPEAQARLAAATAVRRLGRPDDGASAVAWLCREEAGFVTGATLPVDGGLGLAGAWSGRG